MTERRSLLEEAKVTPEEFEALVEVFRLLKRWRDQRNANVTAEQVETNTNPEVTYEV